MNSKKKNIESQIVEDFEKIDYLAFLHGETILKNQEGISEQSHISSLQTNPPEDNFKCSRL